MMAEIDKIECMRLGKYADGRFYLLNLCFPTVKRRGDVA